MAQRNNAFSKVVKCTQQQFKTLYNGGTVGTETGISSDKIYLTQITSDRKSYFKTFYSNGGILGNGAPLPSGCSICCAGMAEINYFTMVVRVKMSVWGNGSGWSSSTYRYFNSAQLLYLLGLNSSSYSLDNYEIDMSRMLKWANADGYVVGNLIINAPGVEDPSTNRRISFLHGYGPYFLYRNDGWFSFARAYYNGDTGIIDASAIGQWEHSAGFCLNGFTVDFTMPIKEVASQSTPH